MEKVGLKHRPTFLGNYIGPALEGGFLKILYPDKPNHPRQKYLLTAKGLALFMSATPHATFFVTFSLAEFQ